MIRRVLAAAAAASLLGIVAPVAHASVPVRPAGPPGATNTVRAVLIGACSVYDGWQTLNATWHTYGEVPIKISSDPAVCRGRFTLADLEATKADTVIVTAIAGSVSLKPHTIRAIQTYAAEGHTLLGDGLDFGYLPGGKEDNALAPVFGLAEQDTWRKSADQNDPFTYALNEDDPVAPVLLRGVPNPYVSSDGSRSQKPTDEHWSDNELAGARYLGLNRDTVTAITMYDTGGYNAIYIADFPYYNSTPDDLQFLYNAIIYPRSGR